MTWKLRSREVRDDLIMSWFGDDEDLIGEERVRVERADHSQVAEVRATRWHKLYADTAEELGFGASLSPDEISQTMVVTALRLLEEGS